MTNIIAILKCNTDFNGKDYYNHETQYNLSNIDTLLNKYREKLKALNPLNTYSTPECYNDMYTYEAYLISKNNYNSIMDIRKELRNEAFNGKRVFNNVIELELCGLTDWTNNGTILLGDKVICTDPCYNIDTWCQIIVDNVLASEYECSYQRDIDENRIATIKAVHKNYTNIEPDEEVKGEVGVDSGQAGIFDFEYYKENQGNDEFYDKCCEATYHSCTYPNPNYKPLDAFINETIQKHITEIDKYQEGSDEYNDFLAKLRLESSDNYINYARNNARMIYNAEFTAEVVDYHERKGYVSSSGYGDGGYTLYVARNNNDKIIGFKISYIPFNEDDYDKEEDDA